MPVFVVVSKTDGSDRALLCADQADAARGFGFTELEFSVEASTRGHARGIWDAQRSGRAQADLTDELTANWGLELLADSQRAALVRLVEGLVTQDRVALERAGAYENFDPYVWTRDYGKWGQVTLIMPPGDARHWGGYTERGEPAFAAVDMWTTQEGPSDLSLEAQVITAADGHAQAVFHNLHVM